MLTQSIARMETIPVLGSAKENRTARAKNARRYAENVCMMGLSRKARCEDVKRRISDVTRDSEKKASDYDSALCSILRVFR